MKVKTILKMSAATKATVYEPIQTDNGEVLIDHNIDILKRSTKKITDTWFEYSSYVLLPEAVLNKEVDMISTNSATAALVIYTK